MIALMLLTQSVGNCERLVSTLSPYGAEAECSLVPDCVTKGKRAVSEFSVQTSQSLDHYMS